MEDEMRAGVFVPSGVQPDALTEVAVDIQPITPTEDAPTEAEPLRARLGLAPVVDVPSGRFEILAISAGEGNGWLFPAETLRASLALWEGAECFVDHARSGRSLRDLAGVCSQPGWDEDLQGIRLVLQPAGPSGGLVAALGREMTADGGQPLPWAAR